MGVSLCWREGMRRDAWQKLTNTVYFLPMTRPHRIVILGLRGLPAARRHRTRRRVRRAPTRLRRGRSTTCRSSRPTAALVASNCRRGAAEPEDRRPARHAAGRRRLARAEGAMMARQDVRRWLCKVAPGTTRYGSVCTGAFVLAAAGSPRRQAGGDALGELRSPGRALSRAQRRCRSALRRRRQGLDLGRRHHRHRHGAGPGRGRSRRRHRQPDRAPLRALCPPAGLPVAVQPAPAGADRGRGAVRRG